MNLFKRRKKPLKVVDAVAVFEADQARVASRGRPDLHDAARPLVPGAKAFMWLLLVIGFLFIGLLAWQALSVKKAKNPDATASLKSEIRSVLPSLKLAQPELVPPPVVEPPPSQLNSPTTAAAQSPYALITAPPLPALDEVTLRRLNSGLQSEQSKSASAETTRSTPVRADADTGPMADKLRPLRLSAARAGRLGNRDYLLTQGAMIDCVMDTRLVSAQAGMISCYATREARSASGRVSLIDPGTKFVGYQQNVLAQGQPRIGVVWSRLETPEGVIVNLDSPGTGSLGEAGLDGYIDTHFAERFGGAIMVSLIGDLGAWLSNQGGNGNNNTVRFDNTGNAAKDAVTTVLENTINIPPTLYRNQGGRVGIYVARDLDFSSVYALRPVRH